MAKKKFIDPKRDPGGAWLEAQGEEFENGTQLKCQATDLADSAIQIDGRASNEKRGRINLKKVAEVLEEYGMDPTTEIVRVLPDLDENMKAKVMLELLQYVQPKLRSIEVSGKDGQPIDHNVSINVGFVGTK